MNPDTTRVIAKRIILTGHPFKVHKKTATVRYLFFNSGRPIVACFDNDYLMVFHVVKMTWTTSNLSSCTPSTGERATYANLSVLMATSRPTLMDL